MRYIYTMKSDRKTNTVWFHLHVESKEPKQRDKHKKKDTTWAGTVRLKGRTSIWRGESPCTGTTAGKGVRRLGILSELGVRGGIVGSELGSWGGSAWCSIPSLFPAHEGLSVEPRLRAPRSFVPLSPAFNFSRYEKSRLVVQEEGHGWVVLWFNPFCLSCGKKTGKTQPTNQPTWSSRNLVDGVVVTVASRL